MLKTLGGSSSHMSGMSFTEHIFGQAFRSKFDVQIVFSMKTPLEIHLWAGLLAQGDFGPAQCIFYAINMIFFKKL